MAQTIARPDQIGATRTDTAALCTLTCAGININLYPGNAVEGGPTQVYLRRHDGQGITWTPLLGPGAPGGLLPNPGLVVAGAWGAIHYTVALVCARTDPAWYWQVALRNDGPATRMDLILTQDIGLSPHAMLRNNEYYVCQYLDTTAVEHETRGYAVAVRNNLGVAGRIPWAVLGSLGKAVSYSTDALVFHHLALRNGTPSPGLTHPSLPSQRYQHEHNLVALQDEPFELAAGESIQRGFFGFFRDDHPSATSQADVSAVDRALSEPEARARIDIGPPVAPLSSLFCPATTLDAIDLDASGIEALWGSQRRQEEFVRDGLAAFFTPKGSHVVLRSKEREVLRPHGNMLRTGDNLVPDESQLTSTTYMNGLFATQLTQGHVGINKITTTARSYLGLRKSAGLRVFVDVDNGWKLLDQPSAYEMTSHSSRWVYASRQATIDIVARAATDAPTITLTAQTYGEPVRFLLSFEVATSADESGQVPVDFTVDTGGVSISAPPDRGPGHFRFDLDVPFTGSDDSVLFSDANSHGEPFVTLTTTAVTNWNLTITGHLIPQAELDAAAPGILRIAPAGDEAEYMDSLLNGLRMGEALGGCDSEAIDNADTICLGMSLPWLVQNAMIHYLSPRGLEQFNGGGWGTRDISQGPVELLLALDHQRPVKELLRLVFQAQNEHGGWPQAFGFFARDMFRHADDDPHGDVVFWPPLALARYINASGDVAILAEDVGFYSGDGQAKSGTFRQHVQRAIDYINQRLVPGTRLISYGHGDWNDSLQPADASMTATLVSSWTVTLHHQMLCELAAAFELAGRDEICADYRTQAEAVLGEFQKWLIVDGVLAGYASFLDPENVTYLVHPKDDRTPLKYSILPIIHALINDMLTPQQARDHRSILARYLVAPDGARLFDRPPRYQGGPQVFFQRAESSTFFGREIGIMYTHAHLRYAEAMARCGDAEAFLLALRQAVPLGYSRVVPNARPRQSNCYFSSSDATFPDRYQASAHYHKVMDGTIEVEGGWRVYSSGAGIAVRLIHECLLGIKRGRDVTIIDPVMPARLDGYEVVLGIAGRPVRIRYRVRARGCGVNSVTLNGVELTTTPLTNPYRAPGVAVGTAELVAGMTGIDDLLVIRIN